MNLAELVKWVEATQPDNGYLKMNENDFNKLKADVEQAKAATAETGEYNYVFLCDGYILGNPKPMQKLDRNLNIQTAYVVQYHKLRKNQAATAYKVLFTEEKEEATNTITSQAVIAHEEVTV